MSTAVANKARSNEEPPKSGEIVEISKPVPGRSVTPLQEVRTQLDSMEPQFKLALPAHIPAERFTRVLMTAVSANQDLLVKCTRSSLFAAAMKCAQDGLLPDGREAALIPFKGVVQYLPMVGGILKKIRNSGQLSTIVARVVYAGDKFRNWIDDAGEHIEYEAADDQDRSIVRRVFAMAKLKDGSIEVEVLQPADIEKIRNVSRAKDNGPWVTWWDQMAQKSAIRRLSKRLPISTDLDDLIRRDDSLYDFDGAREQATLANGGRPQSLAGKLDALSQMPERPGAPPIQHDAVTGEIEATSETSADADDETDNDTGSETAADAQSGATGTSKPDPAKIALLEKLRAKAAKGTPTLRRALGGLTEADQDLLVDEDHEMLGGLAEDADRKAGAD